MGLTSKNTFNILLQKIFELPLWIKQAFYFEIKNDLELSLKNSLNYIKKDESLQLYVPKMTFLGKNELEVKTKRNSGNHKFLEGVHANLSIIEIAINNGWSLSECSNHFINAINQELVSPPESSCIKGTALYMSGHIRLGEYFVKLGKINIEQLDEALRTQKYIEGSVKDKPGLAQILINLGYLSKSDVECILLLKQECNKRYIPDEIIIKDINPENLKDISELDMRKQIAVLTKENNQLKDQISKILKLVN